MRVRNRPRTLGDLISTLCFAGMAMWLASEAIVSLGARAVALQAGTGAAEAAAAAGWRALGLGTCALLCALGALRHVIAMLWLRLFGDGGR